MMPIQIEDQLYLIPLDQHLRGFTHFIGAWLFKSEQTYLIDVGPAATAFRLLKTLDRLGIRHLDAILLTHIHLDHAGGIGQVARAFPTAPIICHQKAIRHLANPNRLWEGSVKTLGDTAIAYGKIAPVPASRLVDAEDAFLPGLKPIMTPGHAPHHVSFDIPPFLFLGETGGVLQLTEGGHTYLRPATPPRFFLETAVESLDLLIARNPEKICYGHFGMHPSGVDMLKLHREQLFRWEKILGRLVVASAKEPSPEDCLKALFDADPMLSGFSRLDRPEQEREEFFLLNSVRGYIGYIQGK